MHEYCKHGATIHLVGKLIPILEQRGYEMTHEEITVGDSQWVFWNEEMPIMGYPTISIEESQDEVLVRCITGFCGCHVSAVKMTKDICDTVALKLTNLGDVDEYVHTVESVLSAHIGNVSKYQKQVNHAIEEWHEHFCVSNRCR